MRHIYFIQLIYIYIYQFGLKELLGSCNLGIYVKLNEENEHNGKAQKGKRGKQNEIWIKEYMKEICMPT